MDQPWPKDSPSEQGLPLPTMLLELSSEEEADHQASQLNRPPLLSKQELQLNNSQVSRRLHAHLSVRPYSNVSRIIMTTLEFVRMR